MTDIHIDDIEIPRDATELEALLRDQDKMRAIFTGGKPEKANEFISNYANVVMQQQQDIATQVRDETQRVLSSWLRENGPDVAPLSPINLGPVTGFNGRPNDGASIDLYSKQGLFSPKAMGHPINNEFASGAEFFQAIWHNTNRDAKLQAKLHRIRNAFSSTVPSEGGFLIPETLRSELLRVSLETSIVRSRARVIPMETLRVPFPCIDSTSNVSSVYGGIVGYWTEEGAALTESQAAFGRIVLDAKKLTAYTEIPNELMSDTISSFEAFLNQIFPEALSFYEDDAFMNGTGVGEPSGFVQADAAVSVAKEAGQAADTIVWENIVKMYARMLPGSLGRAVWIASIDTFPELATMALSVGTGGSAIWLNNGVVGPPMSILGRPVIFTEKLPVLGNAGDIMFVDLGYYLIGDRQVMSAMSSPHYRFGNDKTAFRVIERVDGRPWLQSAITPKNGGNALSPFVKLAERA